MEILSNSSIETKDLASRISKKLKPGDMLFLSGELGSGKTTFVQGLVEALGSKDKVQSPTFVINRIYKVNEESEIMQVNHFDLYRLQTQEELRDLDLLDLITTPRSISIFEWPEIVRQAIENPIEIRFEGISESVRRISVHNFNR